MAARLCSGRAAFVPVALVLAACATPSETEPHHPHIAGFVPQVALGVVDADAVIIQRAAATALDHGRPGAPLFFRVPNRGAFQGSVIPGPVFGPPAQPCREFTVTIARPEAPPTVRAVACREPSGRWRLSGPPQP